VDGDLAVFGVRFPGGNRARAVRVGPGPLLADGLAGMVANGT
jgi:hypothetical protein